MKKAFTLAEVLITLGIIGVVAAITAPMIDGIMPDKNKAKVLKVYKTICDANKEILNDRSLYLSVDENENDDDSACVGLRCVKQPTNPYYSDPRFNSVSKYGAILSKYLDAEVLFSKRGDHRTNFVTPDGVYWGIYGGLGFAEEIMIDVDISEDSPNCWYGVCEKNQHPDWYCFLVKENGQVFPNDPLTAAYLKNPYKLNDKKKDLKVAKNDKKTYIFEEEIIGRPGEKY